MSSTSGVGESGFISPIIVKCFSSILYRFRVRLGVSSRTKWFFIGELYGLEKNKCSGLVRRFSYLLYVL